MIQKKLRIKLEYEYTIDEFDDLTAARRLDIQRRVDNYHPSVTGSKAWENIRRQKRLQMALLNDMELMSEYMLHCVMERIQHDLSEKVSQFSNSASNPDSLRILKKAIHHLDAEDKAFYKSINQDGLMVEHTEVISDVEKTSIKKFDIEWPQDERNSADSDKIRENKKGAVG